ncbi:hypothetical protein [Sphingomonas sp.]|uniref:hypothetical protein n=1 Tax=Sphingomonas sp. TaxID=28214 RepID=UPI00181E248B|nr:hypothetical protein [Sphingomonas sp.]MBA3511081.1 hypothetical protein [Sphingomonas sp.]
MAKPDEVTPPAVDSPRGWTRIEDYLDLARLWRRAGERRRRRLKPRTELSAPRLMSLGMLPFVLLFMAMAVLAFLIIIVAIPGKRYPERLPQPAEVGTAPPGWIDG